MKSVDTFVIIATTSISETIFVIGSGLIVTSPSTGVA